MITLVANGFLSIYKRCTINTTTMRFDSDLVVKLLLFLLALPVPVITDDRDCSPVKSKSIYMNEDILELTYRHESLSEVKQTRENDHCHKSHVTKKMDTCFVDKKKQQRRLKGSKRMRKIQKKKQRWKRHKQKMR